MRIEEAERLLAQPQRLRVAAAMRMRQRQKHAGMVVGVLDRIGDAAVDVQRAHPAAAFGAAVAGHEVDAMVDQPVRGPVPAALLGHREGIDLARHGAHALRLCQRRAVKSQRLVEAAMHFVDAGGRPQRQGFLEQPVVAPACRHAPLTMTRSCAGVNFVSSRPLFSSCSTIFLTFWLWLTGATKVASGVETMATSFKPIADSRPPSLRR